MQWVLEHRSYRLPFRTPVRTAQGTWQEREGSLLRAVSEKGYRVYAECAPLPGFLSVDRGQTKHALEDLGGLLGEDSLARVPASCPCLRGALRFLLAQARTLEGDLQEALVPARRYTPVAALLSSGKAALRQVPDLAAAGFRFFKWKIGLLPPEEEMPLLDDLLSLFPMGAKLRLDANGAFHRKQAERWLDFCSERPIEFLEQPIAADARSSRQLLKGLAEDYPCPLALDESVCVDADLLSWQQEGWQGFFVVKPSLLENPFQTLALLQGSQARLVFSSALETCVGARLLLHLAFHWKGPAYALGAGVWPLFEDARFDGPSCLPFFSYEDLLALQPESAWNALS